MTSVPSPLNAANGNQVQYVNYIDQYEKDIQRRAAYHKALDYRWSMYQTMLDEWQANELRAQHTRVITQDRRHEYEVWLHKRLHEHEEEVQLHRHRNERSLGKWSTQPLKFEQPRLGHMESFQKEVFKHEFKKSFIELLAQQEYMNLQELKILEEDRELRVVERMDRSHELHIQHLYILQEREREHASGVHRRQIHHQEVMQAREDAHHEQMQATTSKGWAVDEGEDPSHHRAIDAYGNYIDVGEFEADEPEVSRDVSPLDENTEGDGQNSQTTSFWRRWWRAGY